MANSSAILFIIILLFLFFTPNTQQPSAGRNAVVQEAVEAELAALDVLRNTTFESFNPQEQHFVNLTGLRKRDRYAWSLLPEVHLRVRELLEYAWPSSGLESLEGLATAQLGVYRNITGWSRGTWVRSRVGEAFPTPVLNLSVTAPDTEFYDHPFQRNITGKRGNVRLHLSQYDAEVDFWRNGSISELAATMTIQDETSYGDGWELKLHGVHFQTFGAAILTSTSDKFSGIFALPHFALSEHTYLLSQHLLNSTLADTINEQRSGKRDELRPWESNFGSGFDLTHTKQCEYIVYLQQFELSDLLYQSITPSQLEEAISILEHEIRCPTGRISSTVPRIHLSMVIFSPDCGFVLESLGPPDYLPVEGHHLQGPKVESYMATAKKALLIFNILLAFQAYLLIRQMKDSSTPSTRSRISFYTLAILSIGDAFTWVVFLTAAFFADSLFINMIMVAFFAFLSGSFFGMKFLMDIWNVQEPERLEQLRRHQRQNTTSTNEANNVDVHPDPEAESIQYAAGQSLPLPVTASREIDTGATPIMLPAQNTPTVEVTNNTTAPSQPSRPTFGALYTRIYLFLLFLIFVSLNALNSWPPALRSLYANTLAILYLSYWVPQIYRNIIRNCRRALSWPFVFGQSILRLGPISYFWGIEANILFAQPDRQILLGLIAWVWVQVLILVGQEILGPRFCVRETWKWVPVAWEYHPILREDEEGATLPLGALQSAAAASSAAVTGGDGDAKESDIGKGMKTFDCAICQQDIEVAIVPATGAPRNEAAASTMTGFLARRAYMVTPCRHIFHGPCLEGWMRYRLQCPICRETLPPL